MFICKECRREFESKMALSVHLAHSHKEISKKVYYDKWMKRKDEGMCKICGNKTEFKSFKKGYQNCCSKKCSKKYNYKQTEIGVFKKFGVNNVSELIEIKNKIGK